jgi:hypothetical protein
MAISFREKESSKGFSQRIDAEDFVSLSNSTIL